MDIQRILDDIETWNENRIEECEDEVVPELFTEEHKHAFIIRWGSKRGDFPQIGSSCLSDEYFIIDSGELVNDGIVIADTTSKKPFNMDTLAYKYLTNTLMKGCDKGYDTVVNAPDGKYKITVERIDKDTD